MVCLLALPLSHELRRVCFLECLGRIASSSVQVSAVSFNKDCKHECSDTTVRIPRTMKTKNCSNFLPVVNHSSCNFEIWIPMPGAWYPKPSKYLYEYRKLLYVTLGIFLMPAGLPMDASLHLGPEPWLPWFTCHVGSQQREDKNEGEMTTHYLS